MKSYEHTQTGTLLLAIYSIVAVFFALPGFLRNMWRVSLVGLLAMTVAMGLFAKMTVIVDQEAIELRLGLGFVRKRYMLKDITAVREVENPWYYGWGIRYTPRGWLYAVSGLTAVELQLQNGTTVRIGTDDAHGLCQALERMLAIKANSDETFMVSERS